MNELSERPSGVAYTTLLLVGAIPTQWHLAVYKESRICLRIHDPMLLREQVLRGWEDSVVPSEAGDDTGAL